MTTITLENISKRYDNGFEAVKNLSLRLESGTFTVLLGPSGCGKTTTLRMIAGLEAISNGNLFFDEERMNDTPPKDRDIGMVFQNYALYPHLTVFENIAFPLRLRREAKASLEERVRTAADAVELTALLDRKPKQLSGGQRQRVALARAIVRKPRVFLFDEPLSNLDAQLRMQMRSEITRIQRMVGATSVYVTHDQSEAMTMADTIVVLNGGELQQAGTPHEIYTNPKNRFVAGFVGSPAINFFEGEIRDGADGQVTFHEHGSSVPFPLPKQALIHSSSNTPRKATLAIRPEHLAFTALSQEASAYALSGIIRRVEFLGHERLVYVETSPEAPHKIVRSTDTAQAFDVGAPAQLFAAPDYCYLFGSNGERL
jgi:multiple sugar transport system ATP-binding protein